MPHSPDSLVLLSVSDVSNWLRAQTGAPVTGRTQSADAQLEDPNKGEVQLKQRSESAVAAAHVLDNKKALKRLAQHHQEECQRKLYDRCARGDAVLCTQAQGW